MEGDRERLLASGMDGYISKPVHSRELFDVIESLVGLNTTLMDGQVRAEAEL